MYQIIARKLESEKLKQKINVFVILRCKIKGIAVFSNHGKVIRKDFQARSIMFEKGAASSKKYLQAIKRGNSQTYENPNPWC